MEDRFLIDNQVVLRLVKEWSEYGRLIIAFDVDSTVKDYHNLGDTYPRVIQLLRDCKEFGAHLVAFTACEESQFPDIEKYLHDNNIPYDGINKSPDFVPFKGRKIYYNILLDDRAGLRSAYLCLKEALRVMKDGD
jgi:hypothetical protein